jgi:hypothetical protein
MDSTAEAVMLGMQVQMMQDTESTLNQIIRAQDAYIKKLEERLEHLASLCAEGL